MSVDLSVFLVSMPWQSCQSPSLPIGILRSVCAGAGRARPAVFHGSLEWADHLQRKTAGEVSALDYERVAEAGTFHCVGDWVFAGVLYGDDRFGRDGFGEHVEACGLDPATVSRMRELAGDFVEEAARRILEGAPDVVGFTTTFMQNVPSLALARRLKQLDPRLLVVFGGANCDGAMGAGLHRSYPFVDLVVRGEGEEVFPQLLETLERSGDLAGVPGLCWRRDGRTVENSESRGVLAPGRIPVPDYDDWFARLRELRELQRHLSPQLPVETSRGCWWGQAHHCTFCGLNGSSMQFRSKTPDRAVGEISYLVERYQVLDLVMVDNIIDSGYYTSVLPRLAALGWDLRIHYEVKANLRPEQITALQQAGVVGIQPGVESLSTPVLKIMDKGVHAVHNVRTLRDGESSHLTVVWNWLVGFPGETPGDYQAVLAQLPALAHLQPPSPGPTRIVLERFSPYFDRPDLGFPRRRPLDAYRHVYDLPTDSIADIAYMFATDPAGIDQDLEAELGRAIDRWIAAYPSSTLLRSQDEHGIVITDRRAGWAPAEHRITDPALIAAYDELEHGRTLPGLLGKLTAQGIVLPAGRAQQWLDGLVAAGLVFEEDGRYLALATRSAAIRPAPVQSPAQPIPA
ncbi:RiPP maturation radical SAM C-methyltransferase [Streptomyces sp. NPDC085614]|uniref:RiPP maturation radical SAM C-methyltransferase n=1 Tax=Streptomyces sp. NPDC085614 TaxID=3365733 RepID=UPI0037D6423F